MKFSTKALSFVLAGALLVIPPAARLVAQDYLIAGAKPVAVVTLSGVDELLGDVAYLADAAGAPQMAQMVKGMTAGFTAGIDSTKPWGVVVTTDGENFNPLGFIPVTDLKTVLDSLKQQQVGEAKDAGDGVWEITGPVPVFVKEKGGWALLSRGAEWLDKFPEDPVQLLDGLHADYDIAVRVYAQNVPKQHRQQALATIRAGVTQILGSVPQADEDQLALQRKGLESSLNQIETLLNETDTLTIGWKIDSDAKSTYLEIGLTAIEGSDSARQMAQLSEMTSNFSGFLLPDAAVTFNTSSKVSKEDIEQAVPLLQTVRDRALKQLDNDENLPDKQTRDAAKDLLSSLFDVLVDTIESGKMDIGAALVLEPKSPAVAVGVYIADGAALETCFKKLVALAETEEGFPNVKFDAETHGGVRFHTMTVPIADEQAQAVLGTDIDVVVGIGETSGYLAAGTNCSSLLKKAIDSSAAGADKQVPPAQLTVALDPILTFVLAVQENPMVVQMAAELEKAEGKDRILIRSIPIENGAVTRIEIEEGILRALGVFAPKPSGQGAGAP